MAATATKKKLLELETIIKKMTLEVFCKLALPEFGVKWQVVVQAVRKARLPMQPSSVARVICKHISNTLTIDDINDVVAKLRLKLVATQFRPWNVIKLLDKQIDEQVTVTITELPERIALALAKNKRSGRPEVQTVLLGDLMYFSVQLVSKHKEGSVLYVASPPGEPVAFVSSLSSVGLLKASVQGLGYKTYEDANLHGNHIDSLLRIIYGSDNANVGHLTGIPEYNPVPIVTSTGIDYTYKQYDKNYIESILGPDPPLLTDLHIKAVKPFIKEIGVNKNVTLTVDLKSENVAETLKTWVNIGALPATSDLFKIFREIKSNNIMYNTEDSD